MRQKGSHYFILLFFFFLSNAVSLVLNYFLLKDPNLNQLATKTKILIFDANSTIFLFISAVTFNNCSFNEIYWSIIPIFQTIYLLITFSDNLGLKKLIHAGAIIFWASRLTFNYLRSWRGLTHDDFRVAEYREKLKDSPLSFWAITFFIFFFITNALLYSGKIAHANFYQYSSSDWHIFDILALGVMIGGALIEMISDRQLYQFRLKNSSSKNICDVGLWRYSRHPNYFGEILFWVGSSLACWGSFASDWTSLLGGVLMTLMFFAGSAQLTDQHILKRRPGYSLDMQEKSMIIPWFRSKIKKA